MRRLLFNRWALLCLFAVGMTGSLLFTNGDVQGKGGELAKGSEVAKDQGKTNSAVLLHPQEAVLYFQCDGSQAHQEEWKKTAAYEALQVSGVPNILTKLYQLVDSKIVGNVGKEELQIINATKSFYRSLSGNGVSGSVSIRKEMGMPHVTIVFPNSGKLLAEQMATLKEMSGKIRESSDGEINLKFEERDGRTIVSFVIPDSPGVEVAAWNEKGHLVFHAGMKAVNFGLAVAKGESPNITKNATWKKLNERQVDFTVTHRHWLDFAALRETYGEVTLGGPTKTTVAEVLKVLDLHQVGTFSGMSGYKGKSLWSESTLECKGEKPFWLCPSGNQSFSLSDLPPLPKNVAFFKAGNYSISEFYSRLYQKVKDASVLADEPLSQPWDRFEMEFRKHLGVDLKKDLLDTLGDMICLYEEPNGGIFRFGIAIQMKDTERLIQSVNAISARLAGERRSPVAFRVSKKKDWTLLVLKAGEPSIKVPVLNMGVNKDWLVVGFYPQVASSFFMRQNGTLESWKSSAEHQAGFASLPKKFSSISVMDVRSTYQGLVSLVQFFSPGLEPFLQQSGLLQPGEPLPVGAEDLAPAELVVKNLFPSISMTTVDESGIHWTSRSSATGLAFVSGDPSSVVAVTAISAALLLPAVQSARTSAHVTTSRNNIKQIALASHNHADRRKSFPPGTALNSKGEFNSKFKPEERLSWMASILPEMEESALHKQLNLDEKWNSDSNKKVTSTQLTLFQNPGIPILQGKENVTHYVGIAGFGKDAPGTPKDPKRAGIFGYNRKIRIRDIKDGMSNTIMFMEVNKKLGPWGQGGSATVRAFTKKPYINGPDGFGGVRPKSCMAGFADGSVRSISKDIDPEILEKLSTKSGGETIEDF